MTCIVVSKPCQTVPAGRGDIGTIQVSIWTRNLYGVHFHRLAAMKRNTLDVTSPNSSNVKSTNEKGNSQPKTTGLDGKHDIVRNNKTHLQLYEIRTSVEADIMSKNFAISIQTRDLVDHAIEIWRLEQRMNKIADSLDESQRSLITNSIQKLKRYLEKNAIEIVDHTNQKFNDGRNLDVLLVEQSPDVTEAIIRETKEPTILCENQLVHKGKVIILEGSDGSPKHE